VIRLEEIIPQVKKYKNENKQHEIGPYLLQQAVIAYISNDLDALLAATTTKGAHFLALFVLYGDEASFNAFTVLIRKAGPLIHEEIERIRTSILSKPFPTSEQAKRYVNNLGVYVALMYPWAEIFALADIIAPIQQAMESFGHSQIENIFVQDYLIVQILCKQISINAYNCISNTFVYIERLSNFVANKKLDAVVVKQQIKNTFLKREFHQGSTLAHLLAKHLPNAMESMVSLLGADALEVVRIRNNYQATVLAILFWNYDESYIVPTLRGLGRNAAELCTMQSAQKETLIEVAKRIKKPILRELLIVTGDFATLITENLSNKELVNALQIYMTHYCPQEFLNSFNSFNPAPLIVITKQLNTAIRSNPNMLALKPLFQTVLMHLHAPDHERVLTAVGKDIFDLQMKAAGKKLTSAELTELNTLSEMLDEKFILLGQLQALKEYFEQDDIQHNPQHKRSRIEHFQKMLEANSEAQFEKEKADAPTFLGMGKYKPIVTQLKFSVLQNHRQEQAIGEAISGITKVITSSATQKTRLLAFNNSSIKGDGEGSSQPKSNKRTAEIDDLPPLELQEFIPGLGGLPAEVCRGPSN